MTKIDKLKEKLYSKPIRNDMTYQEIVTLARYYGCRVESGGKQPISVSYPSLGRVIPIPRHGSCVKEAYIKQLKILFDEIECFRMEGT